MMELSINKIAADESKFDDETRRYGSKPTPTSESVCQLTQTCSQLGVDPKRVLTVIKVTMTLMHPVPAADIESDLGRCGQGTWWGDVQIQFLNLEALNPTDMMEIMTMSHTTHNGFCQRGVTF